jgi:hypothetical protein
MNEPGLEALTMKLIRTRRRNRRKHAKIAITQAEITADLLYPASPRR